MAQREVKSQRVQVPKGFEFDGVEHVRDFDGRITSVTIYYVEDQSDYNKRLGKEAAEKIFAEVEFDWEGVCNED